MKLLGWMHRKFRQDSGGEVVKDFVASGPSCNCLWLRPSPEEHHQDNRRRRLPSLNCGPFAGAEFSFSVVGGGGEEEEELFEGLLTIGTLGSGPLEVGGEEEFDVAEIAEKEAEEAATEAELMAVGAELEKVLEKEGGGERLSSARSSQGASAAGAFPLQGYLFGSAVDVAETAETAEKRRDRRASLGELFMLNKVAEEGEMPASGGGGVGSGRKRARAGVHVMVKKMLGRRGPEAAGSSSVNSGGGCGPGVAAHPAEAKLQKIMQIFHKKVHPENAMLMKKVKSFKKNKDNSACLAGENYFNKCNGGTDALATSKCISLNEGIPSFKSRSIDGESFSNGSREYWIKTDSDFLVLEL